MNRLDDMPILYGYIIRDEAICLLSDHGWVLSVHHLPTGLVRSPVDEAYKRSLLERE